MGVYTDLLANAKSWDGSDGTVARSRVITKHIGAFQRRQGDPPYPAGFAATDEVQLVQQFNGYNLEGTYSITITLSGYDSFTTAELDFDTNPSTWAAAIYAAAQLAGVPIESGDIYASGDSLDSGAATLMYTGAIAGGKSQSPAVINMGSVGGSPIVQVLTVINTGGGGEDGIQVLPAFPSGVTSGFYTLAFELPDGIITVPDIFYVEGSLEIQDAIDAAANAEGYPEWTDGDIVVSGGPPNLADVQFDFSGDTVADQEIFETFVGESGFNEDWDKGGEVTKVVAGQPYRTALAAIEVMSLANSPPPPQGTSSGITATTTRNDNTHFPAQEVLQALAYQAAIDDSSDQLYIDLMTQFGLGHLL